MSRARLAAAYEEIREFSGAAFYFALKDGVLLPLPFVPAAVEDVHNAYALWCIGRRRDHFDALNAFVVGFMRAGKLRHFTPLVPEHGRPNPRRRRVFLLGQRLSDQWDEHLRVCAGVVAFRSALEKWVYYAPVEAK